MAPFPTQPIETQIDPRTGVVKSSISTGRISFLASIASLLNGNVGEAVRNYDWSIVMAPQGCRFVTSDNPAIAFGINENGDVQVEGMGLGQRNVDLVLPLDSKTALLAEVGAPLFSIPSVLNSRQFRIINEALCKSAFRHVFARSRDSSVPLMRPRITDGAIVTEDRAFRERWQSTQSSIEEDHEVWLNSRNSFNK